MATERVGDMTIRELETLVVQIVEQQLPRLLTWPRQPSERPVSEILKSMRTHIIKRAPGQPSTLDMLREDRDQ